MPSTKSAASVGLVAGATILGARAFVAPGIGQQPGSTVVVLRGSAQAAPHAVPGARPAVAAGVAGVAGVAVLGGLVGASRRGQRQPSKIACKFSKDAQIGAMDPVGFFDPLGFCKDEAAFKDLRAKELKHGRLAMMGALGMLTQSLVQVPGMEGVPKDVTACTVGNGQVGFIGTLAIIAALEATVFVQDESKEPGNFGNPVPWFDDYSDEMRSKELNNGRIAMFAAIGQIAAGLYTGKAGLEQFS
mmetsp:Transcript_85700/g.191603  ORF Transcript_85700/g.191603 Transcript_85700/m.191603 type:complete len:245 (-) Transcript_85700:110-844(-)